MHQWRDKFAMFLDSKKSSVLSSCLYKVNRDIGALETRISTNSKASLLGSCFEWYSIQENDESIKLDGREKKTESRVDEKERRRLFDL